MGSDGASQAGLLVVALVTPEDGRADQLWIRISLLGSHLPALLFDGCTTDFRLEIIIFDGRPRLALAGIVAARRLSVSTGGTRFARGPKGRGPGSGCGARALAVVGAWQRCRASHGLPFLEPGKMLPVRFA